MSDEAIGTLKRYFCNSSAVVKYYGSREDVVFFIDVFQSGNLYPYENPDLFAIKDNTVIIIEHFEFDSFHANRKGSLYKKEENRINRECKKIQTNEAGVIYRSKIKGESSYSDYVKNITANFLRHCEKIDTYKKNLISNGVINAETTIKIMFLIEDASPIGNFVFDESKDECIPVNLANCPEFLSLLKENKDVDYVLCCSCVGEKQDIWFIASNQISAYQEKQYSYVEMEFLSNSPRVITCKMNIKQ